MIWALVIYHVKFPHASAGNNFFTSFKNGGGVMLTYHCHKNLGCFTGDGRT